MSTRLFGNYFIAKVKDKFYIFSQRGSIGGVAFSIASEPFHTAEDAHLHLIEKAKEESQPECEIRCIEVINQYLFVAEYKPSENSEDVIDRRLPPSLKHNNE